MTKYQVTHVYSSQYKGIVTGTVEAAYDIYDADRIVQEMLKAPNRNGWNTTMVNDTTRCVTGNGSVYIVEKM